MLKIFFFGFSTFTQTFLKISSAGRTLIQRNFASRALAIFSASTMAYRVAEISCNRMDQTEQSIGFRCGGLGGQTSLSQKPGNSSLQKAIVELAQVPAPNFAEARILLGRSLCRPQFYQAAQDSLLIAAGVDLDVPLDKDQRRLLSGADPDSDHDRGWKLVAADSFHRRGLLLVLPEQLVDIQEVVERLDRENLFIGPGTNVQPTHLASVSPSSLRSGRERSRSCAVTTSF